MAERVRGSLQEYGRGVAGGMLFSLPLLYTMEGWWTGFTAGPQALMVYVLGTFVLLLGYNRYAGIRYDATFWETVIDSVEEMGLGILIAALLLWLLGRIHADLTWPEIVGKITVEAMAVAIGVSVGTAQLGGDGDTAVAGGGDCNHPDERNGFGGQLVIAFCGAVLFAANVAPTEEIIVVAVQAPVWKLLGLAVLSLLLGAFILYYANFVGAARLVPREGFMDVVFGVVVMYAIALLAAMLMLWFFGRFEGLALGTCLAQVVVLGVAGTLGASAGRLLLQ